MRIFNFFIQRLGGDTLIETPSGRGRTDLLIFHQQHKYLIETKIFTDQSYFQNGKEQLAEYLGTEGLEDGYYVVFSAKHSITDKLHFDEVINGKRIHTNIILTNFEKPSRHRARKR